MPQAMPRSRRRPQDRVEHLHGGGLAVGAGDGQPGAGCSRSRSRQASSTSPQTGMPRAAAAREQRRCRRYARRRDHQVDVVGQRRGRRRRRCGLRRRGSRAGVAFSCWASVAASASTVTVAPRWVRLSAAAKPETPMPTTTARTPSHSSRAGPARRGRRRSCSGHPLGVEDAEPGGDADAGDDPEPDHDVTSSHPFSSKWCCSGAIRNIRLPPVTLK